MRGTVAQCEIIIGWTPGCPVSSVCRRRTEESAMTFSRSRRLFRHYRGELRKIRYSGFGRVGARVRRVRIQVFHRRKWHPGIHIWLTPARTIRREIA